MVTGTSGAILAHRELHSKNCAFCGADLDVKEGVMLYDENWYHNECWDSFEKQQEVGHND